MATPVSSTNALFQSPVATPTGVTQSRTAGDSPFQLILTITNQTQQVAAADAPTEVAGTELELETNTDATALDANVIGLLAFVTQILSPPENAAVAQATGQTTSTDPTAQVPVDATAVRTRADQLQIDRGSNFPAAPATPQAATPAQVPTTPAATTDTPALPTTTPIATPTATPQATPSVATFAARPGGSSSIPAQGQILASVVPNVPVPVGLSVTAPPVTEPTPAVAATALPGTQLGDRPATAGERFAADASAGARLVAPAPLSVAAPFASTLTQETTAPTPIAPTATNTIATAPIAQPPIGVPTEVVTFTAPTDVVPTKPQAATATSEALTTATVTPPVVSTAPDAPTVVAEPARPIVTFDQVFARPATTQATAVPTTTVATVSPLIAETPLPPVQPTVPKDEPRPTDDATASSPPVVAGAPLLNQVTAPRATPEAPAPAPATPAAQLADTIVSHARVIEREGGVEFQMRLDPPELGQMQVRLMTRGTEIHGQVLVASEAVRGMIESQLPELRQRLEAAGVTVQGFDVSTDPGTGGNRDAYREAAPQEYSPRAPLQSAAPRNAPGRVRAGELDVTV